VRNATDELHQFHIHQMDFQVTQMNGKPVEFTGHRDNIVVPIRGEVKLIMPFTDPVMVGNFVYHCHIVEHEDGGMMAIIQVYDPKAPDAVPPPWEHVVAPPANVAAKGGPIHLMDHDGNAWRSEDAPVPLLLVSFGYTHCASACPRTQVLLAQSLELLADDAGSVQPLVVTIDPERDTPTVMNEYLAATGGTLVGLTGSTDEIARVARDFGVAYAPLPRRPDGSYGMSHSTDIFLATRSGIIIERFDLLTPPETIAEKVREALKSTAQIAKGGDQ
jgi:cytochrome oxidase Cu insertion factor (SCO1/SenC/PrrC family)